MKRPLVSVIVPVYNGERYLDSTLESIFNQDYHPIEVIVVDDGSTDNSADIARSYKKIHYIYQPNQGQSVARNTGIAVAQGEFIAFLDADDLWMPNKLSIQISYLCNHPEVGYVLANQRMLIEEGVEKPPWYREDIFTKDRTGFFPSTLLVRKSVYKQVGLFDPSYRYGENAEWFARAKDVGIRKAIIPETLLLKRIHDCNLTYHLDECRSNVLKALKASIDRQRSQKHRKNQSHHENGE